MNQLTSKLFRSLGTLAIVFLAHSDLVAAEERPLWLVVTRADLVHPLGPLAEKRSGQGLETVISTETVAKALAQAARRPDFLLLVGDDEPGKEDASWYVPSRRMNLYRWREVQHKQFASDSAWGDLDGDGVPDVAVGRIPARSPEQVQLAVKKILEFERQVPTPADLQMPFWGGSPFYNPTIDTMATGFLLLMLRSNAPDWMTPWVISADPNYPLCGWPPDQPALFTRQIRRGGVCGILMGHANADYFFSMTHHDRPIVYTASAAKKELAEGPPAPPLVFFSCHSGNFARPRPCTTEEFFFFPGGPVATIGATTESHPLTNYFSSLCLLQGLGGSEKRIGSLWLDAQRRAMTARNFLIERVLRDVEGKLEDEIDVEKLRRDQILMYALLGDPATRLRIPEPLKASVWRTETGWRWEAERPEGATSLHVGFRSDAWPSPAKPSGDKEVARAAMEAANATFVFKAMPSPPENDPWKGTVGKAGRLRLVATGEGQIHAAVLKLQ